MIPAIPRSNPNPSDPELFFREWMAKRINDQEFHVATAHWVAENLGHYRPQGYPEAPAPVVSYAQGRVSGNFHYDSVTCGKLASWFRATQFVLDQNTHNQELLSWCLGHIEKAGLKNEAARIRQALGMFEDVQPNWTQVSVANRALKLDSDARRQMLRGTA